MCLFAAQLRLFGDALLHMSAPLQALPSLLHKALVHDPPQSLSDGESTPDSTLNSTLQGTPAEDPRLPQASRNRLMAHGSAAAQLDSIDRSSAVGQAGSSVRATMRRWMSFATR